MDPASLDPRLREDQDSIVVHHDPAQSDSDEDDDQDSPQTQRFHGSGTSPTFTPQTPSLAANTPSHAHAGLLDPNDPKRPRACEACRGLKVKCEPEPSNPDGPCKRCTKAGRNCVITQPTRKRQKKTDSRVAELEKKIDALTASLQATRGGASSQATTHPPPHHPQSFAPDNPTAKSLREWGPPIVLGLDTHQQYGSKPDQQHQQQQGQDQAYQPSLVMAGQKRKFTESRDASADTPRESSVPRPSSIVRQYSDIVDRGIITMDDATVLFRRYTDGMAPHLPAVVFPAGTTVAEVRKTRPILFLSVMAVAASETPNIQRQMVKELMQIFAEKIVLTGEKSLELVQAIMISVIWYFPPEHFEELRFYQMVHMAAVMAIDIGLGRRQNSPKSRLIPYTWRDHPFRKEPLPDPLTIEARRTWLACYFLAANVAMALHRPNLVRWQQFMNECVDILSSSPEAAPTDRYLCHLVWTHRLAEEVGVQFSMDDPTVFINITDQKVQYALRGYEQNLAKYSDNVPKEENQPSLMLSFHVVNLYMHEIALYVDKNNEEYRAPSNAEALRDPIPGLGDGLTSAHIGALSSCLTAIDGIFEVFLSLDVQSIRCLPIFNFVRVAYAVVVLIKIYFSASSPNSELGKVIDKDNMKVAEYLDKLLDKFRETAAQDKSRPAGKFLVVLVMLRGWFHKQGQPRPPPDEQQIDPALRSSRPQGAVMSNPKSQDNVPIPNTTTKEGQNKPAPQQQQAGYNPANTPLQVLSEIATGNGMARDGQASGPTSSTGIPTPAYPAWMTDMAPQFAYNPNTGVPAGADGSAGGMGAAIQQPFMPWMGATNEIDYASMGDGFEQAMGLTLTGFGGASPSDPNYENNIRMMTQNDNLLMNMMDAFQGGGSPFSF